MQKDIREGHAVTVDKVLKWIREDGSVQGVSICDAGVHAHLSPFLEAQDLCLLRFAKGSSEADACLLRCSAGLIL